VFSAQARAASQWANRCGTTGGWSDDADDPPFLADHDVPYPLKLYDAKGKYLFASPQKVEVLAQAVNETNALRTRLAS
jgi:hypothetical protein